MILFTLLSWLFSGCTWLHYEEGGQEGEEIMGADGDSGSSDEDTGCEDDDTADTADPCEDDDTADEG